MVKYLLPSFPLNYCSSLGLIGWPSNDGHQIAEKILLKCILGVVVIKAKRKLIWAAPSIPLILLQVDLGSDRSFLPDLAHSPDLGPVVPGLRSLGGWSQGAAL